MRRADTLREQAGVLRSLAASFDEPDIRTQLLELAARCDALAEDAAQVIKREHGKP